MKQRLFLALPITYGMIPKIISLEKEIQKKVGFSVPWIPIKNLHLTILFLGWQDNENLVKINSLFNQYPFNEINLIKTIPCIIDKIDYGPPGTYRMIWLYLKHNEKLQKLHQLWKNVFQDNGIVFQESQRNFLPHINLARLKIKRNKKLPEIKKNLNWGVKFNRLVLFQSILQKPFVEYIPLKEIKLIEN